MKLLTSAAFVAFICSAGASKGWDGIQVVDKAGFECLKENGFTFFIGRIWKSLGAVDDDGIKNIKNARAAGWEYVDGYIFPCLEARCGSGAHQVEQAINQLNAADAQVGMVWMDLETSHTDWPADLAVNQAFIHDMVKQAEGMGKKVGIYTNNNNWAKITGIDWDGVSHLPLWWANWNEQESFDNFEPFGGWSQPAIHQYKGETDGPCGVNMDLNWYP